MAAATLIAAATACSSADSTKVFTAAGESGTQATAASAGGHGATVTATPAAVPPASEPVSEPEAIPSPVPSPTRSTPPRPSPTETPEPPLRLAAPARLRPHPKRVDIVEPEPEPGGNDYVISDQPPSGIEPIPEVQGGGQETRPPRPHPSRPSSGWGGSGSQGSQGSQGAGGSTGSDGAAGSTGSGGAGGSSSGTTTGAQWGQPILVEDFDGSRIDQSRWSVYDSPNASVNPRTYQATSVGGGVLKMTGGFYGGKDLSGGVASSITQKYGRWEVRLRAEKGAGYSAVALLWPERQNDPEYSEIDFTEIIDPTRQTGGIYVHKGQQGQAQNEMRADFTQWHTVAVDWLPDRLTFWLDGTMVWNYTGDRIPRSQRMGLTLQNDVVCNQWSPCRNASTPKTVSMYVDWVRVYRAPAGV
ncbi:family 16 glycosylhydrolase [Microbispora sp. ATCC PTA-5024]|uniref:family 16 glycosylhydrolase n=1 Tax=Microbispora sp. ATCC PTA-5024 TaxID=316330 RepID=UPI0003DD6FD9|nr:family 16 glycosylhydrolase [Microbispora sp. ATCC PTA-5024]ETK36626.1 hypothetical protein MPTA5024_08100 [Microbispora sp. ATCC PTA-5024]